MKNYSAKNFRIKKLKKWSAEDYLKFFFKQSKRGDYAAVMAYIQKNKKNEKMLDKIRELIRNKKEIATTLG